MHDSTDLLAKEIRRLRGGRAGPRVDLDPASTYEVVTRQMVDGLRSDLQEIRLRINGLIFLVAGSVLWKWCRDSPVISNRSRSDAVVASGRR